MTDYDMVDPEENGEDWDLPTEYDHEPDAATVAFLDQQEAEFAANRKRWNWVYGFDHQCRCSQDYTQGKIRTVTQCYVTLTGQALARCEEATHEIRLLTAMLNELLKMNNDLVKMLDEAGHQKELQEYFGEIMELEDEAFSQLELPVTEDNPKNESEDEESKDDEADD